LIASPVCASDSNSDARCRLPYGYRWGASRSLVDDVQLTRLDLEVGYRMDLVVDGAVLVEIKAVKKLHPVVTAQVLTYLRLSGLRAGLICNYADPRTAGVHRPPILSENSEPPVITHRRSRALAVPAVQ
jgi:hypothetical protein